MKPGSSDRCKSKAPDGLRCHRHKGHDGSHQAPRRNTTVHWYTSPPNAVLTLPAGPA